MKYSEGFRNSILRKVLPPENRSVYAVAKETGISSITIHSWLSKLKEGTLDLDHEGAEPTPSQRGVAEKLRLLLESKTLSEEQKGDWMRRHGMHSEHLALWEQELEGIVTDKQQDLKQENAALKKENKDLKKELARNQAAMAEALALLTLKKKRRNCSARSRRTDPAGDQAAVCAPDSGGSRRRSSGKTRLCRTRHFLQILPPVAGQRAG